MSFSLDSRLQNDCIEIMDLPLCKVLLMNESRYPWFILVPRIEHVRELIDLKLGQQQRLWDESNLLSQFLQTYFQPDKLNVAALGNVVPQLHLHHIARFEADAAWPAPVWGKYPPEPYHDERATQIKSDFVRFVSEQADF
ncbi:MAG: HIT domain-containing protein [Aestuariibacter sp.]